MFFNKVINFIISEASTVLKTTANKPIVDAIKNRRKITFDYYGPRKPAKESVRPGKRIKVEPIAMGLSKKGNLILRAWVEPPSVTKSGFDKGHWRTFMLSRTRNVEITDETFDTKRPGYKEGNDSSMSVTYVTSDWTKKPIIKKYEKPTTKPTQKVEPVVKKEPQKIEPEKIEPQKIEPQQQTLPQPKPEEKPNVEPIKKEPEIEKTPQPTQNQPNQQELPEPKPEEKPIENPEDEENKDLQESIKRIKSLIYSKI
jgi:hypothetical protein